MNILRNHPIFFAGEPDPHAAIQEKPGLSIIARKFCIDDAFRPVSGGPIAPDYNLLENEAAVALSLIINVKGRRRRILEAGLRWTKSIGSIMLVRQDTKDLTIRQVQALVGFCKHKINLDDIEWSESLTGPEHENRVRYPKFWVLEMKQNGVREDVKNDSTPKKQFQDFFDSYRQENIIRDASWADEVSPYDM
ncbi:hypothetical protein EYC80_000905 [Monilinia laxa]|uniref:Uncharacterized protein n=1 Tax=Monilinia laxa TaxID=61186 RepID=A0A5N6K7L6_MONLA|nr:hypothetical protein EYC80_000905 [Monilinia laxa]